MAALNASLYASRRFNLVVSQINLKMFANLDRILFAYSRIDFSLIFRVLLTCFMVMHLFRDFFFGCKANKLGFHFNWLKSVKCSRLFVKMFAKSNLISIWLCKFFVVSKWRRCTDKICLADCSWEELKTKWTSQVFIACSLIYLF